MTPEFPLSYDSLLGLVSSSPTFVYDSQDVVALQDLVHVFPRVWKRGFRSLLSGFTRVVLVIFVLLGSLIRMGYLYQIFDDGNFRNTGVTVYTLSDLFSRGPVVHNVHTP